MRTLVDKNSDSSTVVPALALIGVLVVTFLAYLPGLPGPLLLDDFPQLEGLIAAGADDPATLFGNYIVSTSGPFGRPVSMATFIADAIAHGPDIWWWKFNNLMIHMISGLLVFWLAALLLQSTTRATKSNPWIIAAVVAGFWMLHPLQVSTVLYTVQRMTELSSLFVLAGMIAYVKGRLSQAQSPRRGWILIGLAFGVLYPLSVLSKESGLLFPVYCSLLEFCIFRLRVGNEVNRPLQVLHGTLLAAYVAAALFVLANFSGVVLESYAVRDFSFGERLLTQSRVLVLYLSQLLLPAQADMGFFHDDLQVSTGLLNPLSTLFSLLLLAALITSAFMLRRKLPLFAFGVLFYFASHMLESTVFALELMFEHRNYLGSAGLIIAMAALLPPLSKHRKVVIAAVAIALCGFSFITLQRSSTWSSPQSAYDFMYYAHPESRRLNLVLSNVYAAAGDFGTAREYLANVGSGPGPVVHGLFLDCLQHGQVADEKLLQAATGISGIVRAHTTSSTEALVRESISGRCKASYGALLSLLDQLLALRLRGDLDRQSLLFTQAELLEAMGRVDDAMEVLLAAYELTTDDAVALYRAAATLARSARYDEASEFLTLAYELQKHTRIQRTEMAKSIYLTVGSAYESRDQVEQALATYSEATRLLPGQSHFYIAMAKLLLQSRRFDAARQLLAEVDGLALRDRAEYEADFLRVAAQLSGQL